MATANNISLLVSLSGIQQVESGLRRVATGIGSINTKINALATIALGFAGLNKIEDSIKKVINLGGELNHLRAIGAGGMRSILALKEALQETGGAAGDAATMIRFMQRSIADAATHGIDRAPDDSAHQVEGVDRCANGGA